MTRINKTRIKNIDIEIPEITKVGNRTELYARAWDGKQIGFGKDGSVDLEHFIFVNAPEYVEDPAGDIVRTNIIDGEEVEYRLRHDPEQALLEALEHTISVKQQKKFNRVKRGKRGSTTTTVYPDADTETSTVDGFLQISNQATWAGAHDATDAGLANDSASENFAAGSGTNGSGEFRIWRAVFYFDTSGISASDTIDSATFSLWITQADDGDNDSQGYINVVQTQGDSVSSDTSIAVGDFDLVGDAVDNPTKGSSDVDITGITTGQYTDFTLNSSGEGWVARSGETKPGTAGITYLGVREGHDIEDVPFAGANGDNSRINCRYADQTGTSNDPKLVVEHSAASTRRIFVVS